jgi:hypothetical protein
VSRRRRYLTLARLGLASLLVLLAAAALVTVALNGTSASSAYYGYCPDGSAPSVYYGYCPPPNEPPDCSEVVAEPDVLWPPNHKLVLVTLSGAADPDGDEVTLTITGVTQDEKVDELGDGNTAPDAAPGPASNTVLVRAERSGKGDGRVYRIAFTVSDSMGGTCSGVVTVGVPKSKNRTPVDSAPPSYNSFAM